MSKRVAKDKHSNNSDIYKDPKNSNRPKKKKGRLTILLIIILILIVVITIFKVPIINLARQLPVIGSLLPKQEILVENNEELVANNKKLEQEISMLEKEIVKLEDINEDIKGKNEILIKYQKEQEAFIRQKNEWDENIADDNSELFIEQFEQFYPDKADEIYVRLKGDQILSKEKAEVSSAIGEMESEQAAKALEVLLSTDVELVKNIMLEMKKTQKSEVLNSMSSEGAATIIKLIYP